VNRDSGGVAGGDVAARQPVTPRCLRIGSRVG
jgi:hypothetical protein